MDRVRDRIGDKRVLALVKASGQRPRLLHQPEGDSWRAGCGGLCTSGSGNGPGKRTSRNAGTAPRLDFTSIALDEDAVPSGAGQEPSDGGLTRAGWSGDHEKRSRAGQFRHHLGLRRAHSRRYTGDPRQTSAFPWRADSNRRARNFEPNGGDDFDLLL
jgi:hypothetical protein